MMMLTILMVRSGSAVGGISHGGLLVEPGCWQRQLAARRLLEATRRVRRVMEEACNLGRWGGKEGNKNSKARTRSSKC